MQIILVHPKLKRARSITITRRTLVGAALLAALILASTSGLLSYVTIRHALEAQLPLIKPLLPQAVLPQAPASAPAAPRDEFLRQNIDALAMRLGQLQAQLVQLDMLGERIASKTGVARPTEVPLANAVGPVPATAAGAVASAAGRAADAIANVTGAIRAAGTAKTAGGTKAIGGTKTVGGTGTDGLPAGTGALSSAPGRGGPLPNAAELPPMLLLEELNRAVDRTTAQFERQSDAMSLLESELVYRDISKRLVPSAQPIEDGTLGSRFGGRVDPFTGRQTVHEGLDFPAPHGAPILAAGAGVVVFARWHPAYGNQVDIDHGDGLVTRYAHGSRLLVREGDIVRQGQKIAEVGSTGRSTGPHLHFEVRVSGVAHDPLRYLQAGLGAARKPALARR